MVKVVYSACYGGFGISEEAAEMYNELKGPQSPDLIDTKDYVRYDGSRHDPDFVKVVETLGDKANGTHAELYVLEIPGCEYRIEEYDGYESVEYPEEEQYWILADTPEAREKYPEKFL